MSKRLSHKKTSAYTAYYQDYRLAFALFRERLAKTEELFHKKYIIHTMFEAPSDDGEVEDLIENIQDTIQLYRLGHYQKRDLLTIIELLDSLERLRGLQFKHPLGEAGKPLYEALLKVKKIINQIQRNIG